MSGGRAENRLGVGFSLHAEVEFLELTRSIVEDEVDYYEVAPEFLWRPRREGGIEPNRYFELFAELKRRSGRPFVAHGLAFSLGSDGEEDGERERFALWCEGLRFCHAAFDFAWFSDHLGWVNAAGRNPVFPLPLPFTREAVERVATRLRAIAGIIPTVAFENPGGFARLGPTELQAPFWNAIARAADGRLMLDLHNLHTEGLNLGFDPREVLASLDLGRVVQIHLSGGSESDPRWLASGRTMRLDSHDDGIPEEVWTLLEEVLPHCHGLRGVLVERLNGTLAEDDVPALRDEVRRARSILAARRPAPPRERKADAPLPEGGGLSALQRAVAERIADSDAFDDLLRAELPEAAREALSHLDAEGYRLTSLIVRKLRFERMCLVDTAFAERFETEPEATIEDWEAFVREVPHRAVFPHEDAQAYHRWRAARAPSGD
ncbi:MAG: DUF692 family protein [Planctomycetota bacterium]